MAIFCYIKSQHFVDDFPHINVFIFHMIEYAFESNF